jgi:hypothetical protein
LNSFKIKRNLRRCFTLPQSLQSYFSLKAFDLLLLEVSIEIYTLNGYATQDIDFVMDGYDLAGEVLGSLGFTKLGKNWIHANLGVSVEIPSNYLTGDYNKVTELTVADKAVYVIGIEDIILDRLRAAVHWKSGESREWGYRMLLMYFEDLDMEYIQSCFEHPMEKMNSICG